MKTDERGDEPFAPEPADIASSTECTGLLPALPPSEEAAEEQLALYAVTRRRGAEVP